MTEPIAFLPSAKETPAAQMLMFLSRSKRNGTEFERAWEFAYKRVRWPHDTQHRHGWKEAITWSKQAWENAYEETPDATQNIVTALDRAA